MLLFCVPFTGKLDYFATFYLLPPQPNVLPAPVG